jgi:6-phosphogluconate dehydrogenase (decarboxylating)
MRVGIVGTGEMGRPLVDRLLAAGFDLAAFARRAEVRADLTAAGVRCVDRLADLAERWDAEQERFWVARVSANTWRWRRTPDGWRITERVNANLDGTPEHRAMLAPR